MVEKIKLTKNDLRSQQSRLKQLEKYLPTLQLKKAMLQAEVSEARSEIKQFELDFERQLKKVDEFSSLLTDSTMLDPTIVAKVEHIARRYENIAGVEVPYFEAIQFFDVDYSLVETYPWVDAVILGLRKLVEEKAKVVVAKEKKVALEKEFHEVSIRVNLFEKILIPRALKNIKKIKIFLGDQQLAAVSQAKAAKKKIEEHLVN